MPTARKRTRKPPARKAAPTPVPPTPTPGPGEHLRILDVPFELRAVAQANGARWDKALGAHIHIGATLPAGLEPFEAPLLSWTRWRQDDLAGTTIPLPGDGTITPRAHQTAAADHIRSSYDAGRPGVLVADDVGLGKTIATIEGVTSLDGVRTVLVVCPLSVVAHWRRTIASMGTGGQRWCVINYDRLKQLLTVPASAQAAKKTRTKNKRIADHGKSIVDWDVVILDEAHKLKSPASQRSRAARTISDKAFKVWLSATAGSNPLDLSYVAPLLGSVTGRHVTDLDAFEQWCCDQGIQLTRGAYGAWEWKKNDDDLDRMQRLLFDGALPAGIRRLPQDIAGWPEMNRFLHPIDLDADARRLYNEAWTQFRHEQGLAQRGRDPVNGLAAQTRFRQKASLLRVPGVVDLALDMLDNGHQVGISTVWIETLEAITATLASKGVNVAVIHGQQTPAEREAERIRYQTGQATVCVFTVVEGISLHAGETAVGGNLTPRSTLVADCRWSSLDGLQSEGRAHRNGQRADAYYCFATDTVEEKIVTVLIERMRQTKQMMGDDTETLREIEALLAA